MFTLKQSEKSGSIYMNLVAVIATWRATGWEECVKIHLCEYKI